MKELLGRCPPKTTYMQNENKLISALKNHIVSTKNEILFLKKEMDTKKTAYFYSDVNATIITKAISSKGAKSLL